MTVLPGSLDYLYYNGILDHIPYEAYEMYPVNNKAYAPMNGSQYINAVKQGLMYDSDKGNDTFINRESSPEGSGNKSFREDILDLANNATGKTSDKAVQVSSYIKGALAGLLVLGTIFCLFSGKKSPKATQASSTNTQFENFLSKLNPLTWFKKK